MLNRLSMSDFDAIKRLFLRVFSDEPWHDQWMDEDVIKYLSELIQSPNSLTYGYMIDEKLVAISLGLSFHWWQGKEYFIKEFCVDNKMQQQGIGTRFLNEMTQSLSKHDYKAIWLMTEKSVPAFHFYLKNGFHECENHVMLAKKIPLK